MCPAVTSEQGKQWCKFPVPVQDDPVGCPVTGNADSHIPGPWFSVILLGVRGKEHTQHVPATSVPVHLKCVLILEECLLDSMKYMKYKSFGTLRELCPTILSPSASLVANQTAAFWFQALTYFWNPFMLLALWNAWIAMKESQCHCWEGGGRPIGEVMSSGERLSHLFIPSFISVKQPSSPWHTVPGLFCFYLSFTILSAFVSTAPADNSLLWGNIFFISRPLFPLQECAGPK